MKNSKKENNTNLNNNLNNIDNNHYTDQLISSSTNNNIPNRGGYNSVPQAENNNPQPQEESSGLFTRFILRPISYISSFFCSKCCKHNNKNHNTNITTNLSYSNNVTNEKIINTDRRDEETDNLNLSDLVFRDLPSLQSSMNEFNSSVKSHVGILILYNNNDLRDFRGIVNLLNNDENSYVKEILMENYKLFSLRVDSTDGQRVHFKFLFFIIILNFFTKLYYFIHMNFLIFLLLLNCRLITN